MIHSSAHYAEVLRRALAQSPSKNRREILKRFLRLLHKHGAAGKLRTIFHEAKRQEGLREGKRRVLIESASPLAPVFQKSLEASMKNAWIKETKRPEIFAGVRIFIDDETLIDASARTRLERLFRKYEA